MIGRAFAATAAQPLNEVRLTDAAFAVEKENRGRFGRSVANLLARGIRETIGFAHHKIFQPPK